MKELYWIGRLDVIYHVSIVFFIIFLVMSVIAFLFWNACRDSKFESTRNDAQAGYRVLKVSLPIACISFLLWIFTPSAQESYMIYGIGGTVDWVRNDSVASNLPHKAVEALDVWLDNAKLENPDKE